MKFMLLNMLFRVALNLLLKNTNVQRVLDMVKEAEETGDNNFTKRGYVYRQLKTIEDTLPESIINVVVEMGVVLYKKIK